MIDKNKIEEAIILVKVLSEQVHSLRTNYDLAFANMDIEEPSEDKWVLCDLEYIKKIIGKFNETLFPLTQLNQKNSQKL